MTGFALLAAAALLGLAFAVGHALGAAMVRTFELPERELLEAQHGPCQNRWSTGVSLNP